METTITRADILALVSRKLRDRLGPVRIFALPRDPYDGTTGALFYLAVITDERHAVFEVLSSLIMELGDLTGSVGEMYPLRPDTFAAGESELARLIRDEGLEL